MTTSRVIAVNRYYAPDNSATAQLLTDLAETLAARGQPVLIITSRLRYNDPAADLPRRESVNGVAVRRVWTSRFGRGRLIGRAVDYLTFYLSAFAALLAEVRSGDTIIAETDPPLISIPAAITARLKGAALVNWCQDLYPEVAAALGLTWAKGAIGAALAAVRNWSLRQAATNVVLCEPMRAHVAAQGVQADRITLINNWASTVVTPLPRPQGGGFIIAYSGNLGRAHMIEAIFDLIERAEALPQVRFRFVSSGAGADQLRRLVDARNIKTVTFEPPAPLDRLSESLARADLHLVSLDPACEGLIMPSKLYGVMAAARPTLFLGSPEGAVAHILNAHDAGIVVDVARPATFVPALQALIADPARLDALARNARVAFERHFSAQRSLEAWTGLLLHTPARPHTRLESLPA